MTDDELQGQGEGQGEEPSENNEMLARAEKVAERLEKANEKAEQLVKRNEALAVEKALGGKTQHDKTEKKPETPSEYAQRVMNGQ